MLLYLNLVIVLLMHPMGSTCFILKKVQLTRVLAGEILLGLFVFQDHICLQRL